MFQAREREAGAKGQLCPAPQPFRSRTAALARLWTGLRVALAANPPLQTPITTWSRQYVIIQRLRVNLRLVP